MTNERKAYLFGYGFFILTFLVGSYILIKVKAGILYWLLLLFILMPLISYGAYSLRKNSLDKK